jgi:PhnB protein
MKTTLTPCLNFMGKTKEAMEFYQSILGGELTMQTYKDAGFPHEPEDDDLVIHADLKNDALSFMASDGNKEHPVEMGNNIYMSLVGSDEGELRGFFEKLSQGGSVDMPLEKQFWGDIYGQLTDKFGVHWTVNIGKEEQK